MTVKLLRIIKFSEKKILNYRRKNFSAVVFFNFFFKGEKIMSIPQHFFLVPWGCNVFQKETIDEEERILYFKYPGIKHYLLNKKYFYLGSNFMNFGRNCTPEMLQLFILKTFFVSRRDLVIGYIGTPITFVSSSVEKFCLFLEKEIINFLEAEVNNIQNNLLSYLETNCGQLEKIEYIDDSMDLFSVDEQQKEVFSFINDLNINFCSNVPKDKIINLEDHFSDEFLINLVKELEGYNLIENPFPEGIEEAPSSYKEYLLSLYGPGKWEYTNLEIENLDLSIEELLCLNISLYNYSCFGEVSWNEPVFYSTETQFGVYEETRQKYFWYRMKQGILP